MQTAITDTLQVADENFMGSVELVRAKRGLAVVIALLDFISSMTQALIPKVYMRPLPWDDRIKDCHNRNFVNKGGRNPSQTLHFLLV